MGVLGWRCEDREGKEDSKSLDVHLCAASGVIDSPVIVTGRAKREGSLTKVLKLSWRADDTR